MPADILTADRGGFEIDRDAHSIRFARQVDAPPQAVFDAWTKPEELSQWWDAGGETLSVCEIDLRPGGHFRFVAPSHSHMPFTGTYRRISPPDLLEFEAMDALGRVVLTEADGGTEMVVEIICTSAEHLEHYIQVGVAKGTSQTLDNLVGFIAWEK